MKKYVWILIIVFLILIYLYDTIYHLPEKVSYVYKSIMIICGIIYIVKSTNVFSKIKEDWKKKRLNR